MFHEQFPLLLVHFVDFSRYSTITIEATSQKLSTMSFTSVLSQNVLCQFSEWSFPTKN